MERTGIGESRSGRHRRFPFQRLAVVFFECAVQAALCPARATALQHQFLTGTSPQGDLQFGVRGASRALSYAGNRAATSIFTVNNTMEWNLFDAIEMFASQRLIVAYPKRIHTPTDCAVPWAKLHG